MIQFSAVELIAIGIGLAIVIAAVLIYAHKHSAAGEIGKVREWMKDEFRAMESRVIDSIRGKKRATDMWSFATSSADPLFDDDDEDPAAPAASVAAAPSPAPAATKASAEPKSPSTGSGGTVSVVPASDAAAAKQAALDKVIADAEAKIADARAKKKAVDDALAALQAAVN